jgi:hypothetical protein
MPGGQVKVDGGDDDRSERVQEEARQWQYEEPGSDARAPHSVAPYGSTVAKGSADHGR